MGDFFKGGCFHDVGEFFITGANNFCAGSRFYTAYKIAGGELFMANIAPWRVFPGNLSPAGGVIGGVPITGHRPSGWHVSYASLIRFTLAGLKAYEWGWSPANGPGPSAHSSFFDHNRSAATTPCVSVALAKGRHLACFQARLQVPSHG